MSIMIFCFILSILPLANLSSVASLNGPDPLLSYQVSSEPQKLDRGTVSNLGQIIESNEPEFSLSQPLNNAKSKMPICLSFELISSYNGFVNLIRNMCSGQD